MAFLLSARRLAAAAKLPFILLASPPLCETSSLFERSGGGAPPPLPVMEQHLRHPVPPISRRGDATAPRLTPSKQKELKKRGFNTIIRWCAYHQDMARHPPQSAHPSEAAALHTMDSMVVQWVRSSAGSFSCGQSLVVVTFLCDALLQQQQHRASRPAASADGAAGSSGASPSASTATIDLLTHTVELLMSRAITSEQLELQPFFILLSSVYGLHRITDGNPLALSLPALEGLQPPPALWFALLHQLRAFGAVREDVTAGAVDASVSIEALLTVLLLFDDARCTALFAPNDYKMLDNLVRRLLRLIQPAVAAARAARLMALEAHAHEVPQRVLLSSAAAPPSLLTAKHVDDRDEADTADADSDPEHSPAAVVEVGVDTPGRLSQPCDETSVRMTRQRISLHDSCRVLRSASHTTPAARLDLLEYFLCVTRDPATLTREEVAELPKLFVAVRDNSKCRASQLADYVAHVRGVYDIELLVPLLPFMSDRRRLVAARIGSQLSRAAEAAKAGDGVGPQTHGEVRSLAPHLAGSILGLTGTQLAWASRKFLILRCLSSAPQVQRAVEDVLASCHRHAAVGRAPSNDGAQPSPKVPLSPDVCNVLRALFVLELRGLPRPLPLTIGEAKREELHEAVEMAAAVARSVDWQGCTRTQLAVDCSSDDALHRVHVPHAVMAASTLTAYLDARYTYRFLTSEDEMDDRALLNSLVLPLLRNTMPRSKMRTLHLVAVLLPHLKSVEFQRQLVQRVMKYNRNIDYLALLLFVKDLAPAATELGVFSPEQLAFLLQQQLLSPRSLKRWLRQELNYSKTYTTVLVRTVRYVLAAGAMENGISGMTPGQCREVANSWFAHYFHSLSSDKRKGDLASSLVAAPLMDHGEGQNDDHASPDAEGSAPATAEEVVPKADAGDETEAAAEEEEFPDGATSPGSAAEGEEDDADGSDDGPSGEFTGSMPMFDGAFTSPVTEDDIEEVLSLMLQVGCKITARATTLIAQRLRDKADVPLQELLPAFSTAAQFSEEAAAVPAVDDTLPRWSGNLHATEDVNINSAEAVAVDVFRLPLTALPPPAHFVMAVRADSVVSLPLSSSYLRHLLRTCELPVFHHVLSAFFAALKRRRAAVVLLHDLQIAEVTLSVLRDRLTDCEKTATAAQPDGAVEAGAAMLSTVAFKSLVHLLFHFSQVPPRTRYLRPFVKSIHQDATSPAPNRHHSGGAVPPADADVDRVVEENRADGDGISEAVEPAADELHETLHTLHATHAEVAALVLPVTAFVVATQMKELALAHLQRMALFFPQAAHFAFFQLQPHLGSFTQRELLQLASQYPPGAQAILAQMSKLDIRVSVDLTEFVPVAKKLPMVVSEAVIRAHAPYLTIAWTTRLLSALAARHEEMPLSLLRLLLARVEVIADTATPSDKSLLLLILQGYLLFQSSLPTQAAEEREQGHGDVTLASERPYSGSGANDGGHEASSKRMEELFASVLESVRPNRRLTTAEQQQRMQLICRCCDQLLSLDGISTLEELRFFLISYPPSLHQVRERGVVAKVEEKLLPDMLAATPLQWRSVNALVVLLAEHHVLLPSTAKLIVTALFDGTQLELLQQHLLTSSNGGDGTPLLEACLRIAVTCADAAMAQHPTASSTSSSAVSFARSTDSLLETVNKVLSVFDTAQEWLTALTFLLSATAGTGKHSSSSGAASHASFSATSQMPPPPAISSSQYAVARHVCSLLLREADELNPSEVARLVQSISRLRVWDLALPVTCGGSQRAPRTALMQQQQQQEASFTQLFCAKFGLADAHSRCVLLKATTNDAAVFRHFEGVLFPIIRNDVALLSSEDVELVLAAALQMSDETLVEPLLDAVGTHLLPMAEQCRRSTLVRLLQCHLHFRIDDAAVTTAALGALERQSSLEVKLDAAQVITVLQAIARLPVLQVPERLVLLCFQRLEKLVQVLSPVQLYYVGRLIIDLEMGYTNSVHVLVTQILDSRDGGPRGHGNYREMAEELCDVFEVEVAAPLRASRLRKRKQKQRVREYWAAQRRVVQAALL